MNVIFAFITIAFIFSCNSITFIYVTAFAEAQISSANSSAAQQSHSHAENSHSRIKVADGKQYHVQTFAPVNWRHTQEETGGKSLLKKAMSLTQNYTQCETPNKDSGICILLKDCLVLQRVQSKDSNKQFFQNSVCEKNDSSVKYCCGQYENYKYLLPKRPLPKSCGYEHIDPIHKGRIFGGAETKLGEFPWLARIIHTSSEGEKTTGCEGFLIHKRFVLTAAHCVKSPRLTLIGNITEIQLGEHNTQTEKDCNGLKCADPLQTMKVKSIIPHPEYTHNSRDHHYDIALIYLKGEAIFSDYVQPICLSEKSLSPEAYWISGWGKTENGSYSNAKIKVSLPPFDLTECNKIYSRLRATVGQSQLCAGGEKNKDSCVGDSGGPLMFSNNESRWYAIGLVSFGVTCGLEGWPGVYTSIPYFYNWIVDQIIQIREPSLLENHH